MSHFCIYAWDMPNSAPLRRDARDAHFAHIETVLDKIDVAGPLKNDDGDNIGSLFIVKVANRADAEAFLRADPYFAAGIWQRWEIHPFLPAAGKWIGGKTW
jgi:uncharacterized protein